MKRARASVFDPALGMSELGAHDSASADGRKPGAVPLSRSVFVAPDVLSATSAPGTGSLTLVLAWAAHYGCPTL